MALRALRGWMSVASHCSKGDARHCSVPVPGGKGLPGAFACKIFLLAQPAKKSSPGMLPRKARPGLRAGGGRRLNKELSTPLMGSPPAMELSWGAGGSQGHFLTLPDTLALASGHTCQGTTPSSAPLSHPYPAAILHSGTPWEPEGKSQGLPLAKGVCLPCLPMRRQSRMGGGKDFPGLSHFSLTGARGLWDPSLYPAHTPTHTPGAPSGSSTPSGSHPKALPGLAHVPESGHMCRNRQPLKEEDFWSTGHCHESSA